MHFGAEPPKVGVPFEMTAHDFFKIGDPFNLLRYFGRHDRRDWTYDGKMLGIGTTRCFEVITEDQFMNCYKWKKYLEQKYGELPMGQWLLVFAMTFNKYTLREYENKTLAVADPSWIVDNTRCYPSIWSDSSFNYLQMSMAFCNVRNSWLVYSDKEPMPLTYS